MFSLRNKKDISIFRMKKEPYLLLCTPLNYLEYDMEPHTKFPGIKVFFVFFFLLFFFFFCFFVVVFLVHTVSKLFGVLSANNI